MYGTKKLLGSQLRRNSLLVSVPKTAAAKLKQILADVVNEYELRLDATAEEIASLKLNTIKSITHSSALYNWVSPEYIGTFDHTYTTVLAAYYILLKSTPGWPIDFLCVVASMGCYKSTHLTHSSLITTSLNSFIMRFIILEVLLRFFKLQNKWRVCINLTSDKAVLISSNYVYTGNFFLERII